MGKLVDNIIAFRLLKMMVTPFDKTEAFKLGIIDADGKLLKRPSKFTRNAEEDAYNYLTRFVFNMKRLINKFGGESKLKSVGAALYLFKEHSEDIKSKDEYLLEHVDVMLENKFIGILSSDSILDESIMDIVKQFFLNEEMVTTSSIDINTPTITKKQKTYKVLKRQIIDDQKSIEKEPKN